MELKEINCLEKIIIDSQNEIIAAIVELVKVSNEANRLKRIELYYSGVPTTIVNGNMKEETKSKSSDE